MCHLTVTLTLWHSGVALCFNLVSLVFMAAMKKCQSAVCLPSCSYAVSRNDTAASLYINTCILRWPPVAASDWVLAPNE